MCQRSCGLLDRLELAHKRLLPILDFARVLHPAPLSKQHHYIAKAEKAIYLCVLDLHVQHLPSAASLAHELGHFSMLLRWKLQTYRFYGTILSRRTLPYSQYAPATQQEVAAEQEVTALPELPRVALPAKPPQDWIPLQINILSKREALLLEQSIARQSKRYSVRIYTDAAGNHDISRLGAAFVAICNAPPLEWQDTKGSTIRDGT